MTTGKSLLGAQGVRLSFVLLYLLTLTAIAVGPDRSWWQKNLAGDSTNLVMRSQEPEIVAVGQTVHMLRVDVYADYSSKRLVYLRSTDGGNTFEPPVVLQDHSGLDAAEGRARRLAVDGANVHIISTRRPVTGGNWYYVLEYYQSTNHGATFEPTRTLATGPNAWHLQTPHITAADGQVTIGYVKRPNWYTDYSLVILSSSDAGASFASTVAANTDRESYDLYDLRRVGSKIGAVLLASAGIPGTYGYTYRILVAASTDAAAHWNVNQVCSTNSAGWPMANTPTDYHEKPDLAWAGEKLFVTWTGADTNDVRSTFVARSLDNGVTFEPQVNLSAGQTGVPQVGQATIAAAGDHAYVVWNDPNTGIWMRRSTDGGASWHPAQFLFGGWWPLVAIDPESSDGSRAHVMANPGVYRYTENGGQSFSVPVVAATQWEWWGSGLKMFQWSIQPGGKIHMAYTGVEYPVAGSDYDFYYRRLDGSAGALSALNQCLVLNGNNSELHYENMQISGGDYLQFSNSVTLEMWVKPEEGCPRESTLLFQPHADHYKGVLRLQTHDYASFRRPSGKILTTNGVVEVWGGEPLIDGEWHHVAMTYNALAGIENLRLYVDGKLSGVATGVGPLRPQNEPIYVGGGAASAYNTFNGAVDEVRIWDRALSEAELRVLTTARVLTNGPGLVASYPLDGSTKEVSGRSRDGVLMFKETFAPVSLVRAPAVTSPAFSVGSLGNPFHMEVVADWATGFALIAGSPPPGLTFNPALGVFTGVPSEVGLYLMTVMATNDHGSATQAVRIVVHDNKGLVFRDDFNARTNSGWLVRRDYYADGYYSFYPGGIKMRGHWGDVWGGNNSAGNMFYRPAPDSDFTMTVGLARFIPGQDQWVQFAIGAFNDENNYVRSTYGWVGFPGLSVVKEIGAQPVGDSVTNDVGEGPILLRLSKQGNLYQSFWSTNGVDFLPAMAPVEVAGSLTNVGFWFGIDPRQTNLALVDFFEIKNGAYPFFIAPSAAGGQQGSPFVWSMQGPVTGAFYTAAGLPQGLMIDPASGLITGMPAESGVFDVMVTASNHCGMARQPLRITLSDPVRCFFRDDFNSEPVAGWNPWADNTNYYAFTNSSQLVLRANNGDTWTSYNRPLNLFAIDAPNASHWVATLGVSRYEPSPRDYNSLHLVAWNDTDNNVRFTYSYGGGTRSVGITSENRQVMDSAGVATNLGSAPFQMRLVRAGSHYTGYISTNGVDFVPLVTNSVSLASAPAKIGFWMGIDPAESNVAWLDFFEVHTWGPLLRLESLAGQPQLTWHTENTVTYQLESSSNLETWNPFGSAVAGHGGVTNVPVQSSGGPMFFRLNAW